ncbi:MAG: amidohydrolase [Bacteroidetes bacterium]|nr:amidohydrolase [Bacteroidota bacterium]
MPDNLKITLIQSFLHWEDKQANVSMFDDKIAAVKEGTDIIILPEMFSTGFTMNAKAMAEPMNGPAVEWMKKKALEKNCVITGSMIISENGAFYNRLIWMNPDGSFLSYDKRHLFRLAHEEQSYASGKNKIVIEYKGWKILPLICFDLRFPVWSRRTKSSDYDLLLYVANWPERRINAWNQLLIARAIENQCYVAGLNRVGNDGNDIYHSGESAVINCKGENISGIPVHEEYTETITLNKPELNDFRKQLPFIEDGDDFTIKL